MPDKYKRKNDNHKKSKSYRQSLLEQNVWRCDCTNEGKDTDISKHQQSCLYGVWYVSNDLHLDEGD